MHFRPFRSLSAVAVASLLTLSLVPIADAAGEKDKEAQKLFDQAMGEDYLNTDFAKAEKKLKDAVKKCGADSCSPSLLGQIHVALGTVYGVGLNKPADAKEEFIAALKADPKAALDPALSNADLAKIFADAKKSAGGKAVADDGGGKKPPKGGGDTGDDDGGDKPPPKKPPKGASADSDAGTHTPPPESLINTPIPLYFEPSEEVALSKATLRYKPFGGKTYKSVEMKKMGKGFGAEIPCDDVTTTGDVKYFFALTDDQGDAAGTLGSTKEPFKVSVKNDIEGDAPSFPGKKPPDQCKAKEDCPPGLPGCPGTPVKHGDKGWGASCEAASECQAGLTCLNGSCEEGKDDGGGGGGGSGAKGKTKRNMIGLWAQFDVLNISSKADVCTPKANEAANYTCFVSGTKHQFDGPITPVTGTNGIDGGLAFGDVRLLLSYDRQLVQSLPLTVGVRLGWAFGGSPSPDNADMIKADKRVQLAKGFFPFHYEVRAAYHFLGNMLEGMKFRPYAFLAFGGGQVNASVPVTVCGAASGGKCSMKTTVDAYQITGLNFVGFGGGTTFGITPFFGVAAEVKLMLMVPTFGFVLAPQIGPVFAF